MAAESLGNACYKSGIEAQRAAGFFRQSLRFYEELGNRRKAATIHSQLGREYMHSGNLAVQDLSSALEHFQQASAILEGEPEASRDDCLLIGKVRLEGLPTEDKRSERIQIDYVIDANGMVTATGTDKVSGKTASVAIDYKKGIEGKEQSSAA